MRTSSTSQNVLAGAPLPPGLAVVAIALCLLFPRAAPASLAVLLIGVLMTSPQRPAVTDFRSFPGPFMAVMALAGWAFLSVVWAADRSEAIGKSLLLALFAGAVRVAAVALQSADREALHQLARALGAAFCASLVYLLFEEATGHFLKRFLFETLPILRPKVKHVAGGFGEPLAVSSYITNRNLAAVALLIWPSICVIRAGVQAKWRAILTFAAITVASISAGMSAHETSMIAIPVSGLVLVIALWFPRAVMALIAAGWLVATLLVVPLAHVAFNGAELHTAKWLPDSARHRIVLWAYTAQQVADRPVLGVGAASTKLLDAQRGPRVEPVAGTRYEWRSTPHAHNVYLQTWYELGAVGALLLAALGLSIIHQIGRLPSAVQPYALATLTASATTAAFTWGMWQAWFMALFALACFLVMIAAAVVDPDRRTDPR